MTGEAGASEAPLPGWPALSPRDRRARTSFLIIAGLTAAIALIFLALPGPIEGWRKLLLLLGPALSAAALVVAASGIAGRRPWAIGLATPLLVVLLVEGVVFFVIALLQRQLQVPADAALAAWSLAAPAGARDPEAAGSSRATAARVALIGAVLLGAAWPFAATAVMRPGGVLDAQQDSIQASLQFEPPCAAGGPAGGAIDVAFEWQWLRPVPFPSGTDSVVMTWVTVSEEGAGYRLDSYTALPEGVIEQDRSQGSNRGAIRFDIDLAARGAAPGQVRLRLVPPTVPPAGPVTLQVTAKYVHAVQSGGLDAVGAWSVVREASCP